MYSVQMLEHWKPPFIILLPSLQDTTSMKNIDAIKIFTSKGYYFKGDSSFEIPMSADLDVIEENQID